MKYRWYKKWFAARLADDPTSKFPSIISAKKEVFQTVSGKVLEIAAGTGVNMRFFPSSVSWYGLDPNPFGEKYASREAKKYGLRSFHYVVHTAEDLPFPDNTFDSVVATHALCSVDNPHLVLSEIYRVLKPKGTFYFLEHVRSDRFLSRTIQYTVVPLFQLIADGCHPTRDTEKAIRTIPFRHISVRRFHANIPVIGDHIVGTAVK